MKQILLLLLMATFLNSCDKIKEASTVDFYTTLLMEIPVAVEDTTTETTKAALEAYPFSQTLTQSLEDIENVSEYLDHLKSIEINDIDFEFSGLTGDQMIEKIDISLEGIGILTTIENISTANLLHHPEINSSVLVQIANLLYFNKQLTMTVSGTTSHAPMNFVVDTSFDLHIEASPI